VPTKSQDQSYNASSPDELALVNAAKYFGCVFLEREHGKKNTIKLDYRGKKLSYELLNMIEFDSARKRMTSVVKAPDGRIYVMTKGADSIILPLLKAEQPNPTIVAETNLHLKEYALTGLRTLLIAQKELSFIEYEEWLDKFDTA